MIKNRRYLLLSFVIFLGGCSSIPISTMYKMATMNPLDLQPEQIVAAASSPEKVGIGADDVQVTMTFESDVQEMNIDHRFFLQPDPSYPIPSEIKEDVAETDQFTVLRLSKADAMQFKQSIERIKAYREHSEEGAGSMGLNVVSACSLTNNLNPEGSVSLYLKLRDDEDFFTFIEGIKIADLDNLSKCDEQNM